MLKHVLFLSVFILTAAAQAFEQGQLHDSIYLYQSSDDFTFTKENLEMAITNRGLRVSGTLHVEEMLSRTGPDLGFDQPFIKAESIEFCSAVISHKMVQLDPLNMSICPFTIAVFSKKEAPESVYVAFRTISLAGKDAQALNAEIEQFIHGIVREGLGLD